MSTHERLKALCDTYSTCGVSTIEAEEMLRSFPQLLGVVEAAVQVVKDYRHVDAFGSIDSLWKALYEVEG